MTKEELIKNQFPNDEFLQSSVLQIVDKCVADLEKRISVLLSCKNCPDNKGGFICQKEYEDKCLAQKIQYIKELKEENTELEKENAELNKKLSKAEADYDKMFWNKNEIISKAKTLISFWVNDFLDDRNHSSKFAERCKFLQEAEQFISEVKENV